MYRHYYEPNNPAPPAAQPVMESEIIIPQKPEEEVASVDEAEETQEKAPAVIASSGLQGLTKGMKGVFGNIALDDIILIALILMLIQEDNNDKLLIIVLGFLLISGMDLF